MIELNNVEDHLSFRCEVIGYEFPDNPEDDWCLLKVDIKQGYQSFEAVDPAIEASDLVRIFEWFKCLAEHRLPPYAELCFTEPCISFGFLAHRNEKVRISIELSNKLKPDFNLSQFGLSETDWRIVFELDNVDFERTLHGIEAATRQHPIRCPKKQKRDGG
ncbi:hypothetical protein ACFL2Q_19400 [Thermodesulfobacteriota bacterium]